MYTNEYVARFFGVSIERVKAQHARNASELAGMAAEAHRAKCRVNGYTARQLSQMAMNSRNRSK